MAKHFPFYRQPDVKDCGPSCLRMISKYYGKYFELQTLREKSSINKDGVSMLGLIKAAESIGYKTIGAQVSYETLLDGAPLPCIVHWNNNHFIVLYKITKKHAYVADPSRQKLKLKKDEFISSWAQTTTNEGEKEGIVLLLEPTDDFFNIDEDKKVKYGFKFLINYLKNYKKLIAHLILILLCGSIFQLIFPFLTKAMVDNGILKNDLHFVYLVLIGQIVLFIAKTVTDFFKNWILLHITARINISIISDLFFKLMKLPLGYFDSKVTGDILQRVNDHNRIEQFLTGAFLNTIFATISLVVFSIVLASYNVYFLIISIAGAALYILWISLFLKYRKRLDYQKFDAQANSSSKVIQMVTGMQEIKINNSEQIKRNEWERLQAKLFRISIKALALRQNQQIGGFLINEGKNIFLTFLAAKLVIDGQITLGTMLAIQYIIGQINSPIEQYVEFIQSYQDASLSIERLNEIHNQEDEEPYEKELIYDLPKDHSITLSNISFSYPGAITTNVLNDLSITIPKGKVTAIVGLSGSGKTTLLKLLLKFYKPNKGDIKIGDINLDIISNHLWRENCGVVMQDGFIFSETIANNIAMGDKSPDLDKLIRAAQQANIFDFIQSLPLGFNTKIGEEGNSISGGQKQRLLIARVIYKNPEYIILDEATNALDANNEKIISNNLDKFFKGKTVIIVAHRLSTVKNADQIMVLEYGNIIESGTHKTLTNLKGKYYDLVKNQLELGN